MGQTVGSLFCRCQKPAMPVRGASGCSGSAASSPATANTDSSSDRLPDDEIVTALLLWIRTGSRSLLSNLMSRFFRPMGPPTREVNWTKACDAIARNNVPELTNLLQELKLDPNFAFVTNLNHMLPDPALKRLITGYAKTDQLKVNLLHVSIMMRNKVAAELLLKHGADPCVGPAARTSGNAHTQPMTLPVCTAVHFAVVCNEFPILNSLVKHVDSNAEMLKEVDQYNLTALDQALRFSSRSCALYLIESGAHIAMDENNTSILTICEILQSSSFNKRDHQLLSAILDCDYAAGGDVMSAFLNMMMIDDGQMAMKVFDKIVARSDFCPDSRSGRERSNYLHLAAGTHSISILKRLSELSVKVETNACGENPLHVAVREDRNIVPSVKFLISLGCDIDQEDASGCTPLIAAIDSGNTTAILCLLEAGCKLTVTPLGYTVLHLYCNSGGTDMTVIQKLALHCDVNAKTKFDWTALHFVVDRCHSNNEQSVISAISELISLGADALAQNSAGDTILTIAVIRGHSDVISELINESFIRDQVLVQLLRTPDTAGFTPLHIAVLSPLLQQKTVVDLISQGSDVNACDKKGRTTLFFLLATEYSAQNDDVRRGLAPPDTFREFRCILLRRNIFACPVYLSYHPVRMWTILDHMLKTTNVDINCELIQMNETPLNLAFAAGEYNLMRQLLAASADVSRLSGSKFTPHPGMLDICKLLHAKGFDDFAAVLQRLKQFKLNKSQMLMMDPVERRELDLLEKFLVSLLMKPPQLIPFWSAGRSK